MVVLSSPVLASGVQLGFDQPSYLIAPDVAQQVYVEVQDGAGGLVKTDATTYVWVSPSSPTAQISTKISSPVFISTASAKLTVAKGDSRKSFLYRDRVLGEALLTATSSALLTGTVHVTIGYPPPQPVATATPPPVPTPTFVVPVTSPADPVVSQTVTEVITPVEQTAAAVPIGPLEVTPVASAPSAPASEAATVLADQIGPASPASVWDDLYAWFQELFFTESSP